MLSEPERTKLEEFISSNLFARAKEEVFKRTNFTIKGDAQPNAFLLLAQEKGVRLAFDSLQELIKEPFVYKEPTTKSIHPNTK